MDLSEFGPIARISVIVPMRNEAEHMPALVADLAEQDYDGELEVLVADGDSEDGSRDVLQRAAAKAGLDAVVLDNPRRVVSAGLNACIRRASGDLIVRLDCHTRYPPDYLRRCARLAEDTGAWNVGGQVVPEGVTTMERAVACAMASPFGGIGWTRHAAGERRATVDTVTFGAFRPRAFAEAGLFDEDLVRNQDDEFNLRLRLKGGEIVLDPTIEVRYRPRGSLAAVWRQYFEYGLWKVPVMRKHRRTLSLRSLAPLALVASLTVLGVAAPASRTARLALLAEGAAYTSASLGFALMVVRGRDEPLALTARVAAVFPVFHVGYGTGMARGWLRAVGGS
jgi:succinoglycan biosynthesis protein ExoA